MQIAKKNKLYGYVLTDENLNIDTTRHIHTLNLDGWNVDRSMFDLQDQYEPNDYGFLENIFNVNRKFYSQKSLQYINLITTSNKGIDLDFEKFSLCYGFVVYPHPILIFKNKNYRRPKERLFLVEYDQSFSCGYRNCDYHLTTHIRVVKEIKHISKVLLSYTEYNDLIDIVLYSQDISERLLEKYHTKFSIYNWATIKKHQKLSKKFKEKYNKELSATIYPQ